jgi:hypothetical protein
VNKQPDLLTQLLAFLSSIAHYVGLGVVKAIEYVLPSVKDLSAMADPIGYLAILTGFVILTSVARKVALIVLIVGWALIVIRILLVAFHVG